MNKLPIIGVVVLILSAVFVTTNQAAIREAATQVEIPSVKGDLKVSYTLVFPDGASEISSSDQPSSEIEFHPEYLVVKGNGGGGKVIPTSRIKTFNWTGK